MYCEYVKYVKCKFVFFVLSRDRYVLYEFTSQSSPDLIFGTPQKKLKLWSCSPTKYKQLTAKLINYIT